MGDLGWPAWGWGTALQAKKSHLTGAGELVGSRGLKKAWVTSSTTGGLKVSLAGIIWNARAKLPLLSLQCTAA